MLKVLVFKSPQSFVKGGMYVLFIAHLFIVTTY